MQVNYQITQRQTEALKYLTSNDSISVLFGGAKGGGKSYLFCLWVLLWSYSLIKFFDINKIDHPLPIGWIGRKRAVDFNDTTFETFKRVVPSHMYRVNTQEKEIIFNDEGIEKFKVLYGGLDDQKDINKFNSAEFCFIGIDQAEETLRSEVAVLQGTLRFTINGLIPPYKQLYTANPSEGWLKEDFILGNRSGTIFIPALPDDNPYLPPDYKDTLRNAFGHDPQLLRAYLEGDWDAFANVDNAVFRPNWFKLCRDAEDKSDDDLDERVVAVDVATKHGENETVLVKRLGDTIKEILIWKGLTAPQSAQKIKKEYESFDATVLVIDSDGFGEGISDILESLGTGVLEFHGGTSSQAVDERRFRNLRSQFYVFTARMIEKGQICLKHLDVAMYEKLKNQSIAIQYKPPDPQARIQIESKQDMMARGIKSPDVTDALVYSQYAIWMARFADVGAVKYR
jgi:phage terminase large subunit